MIVTAMLAWYDEDPDILYRAVHSAGVIADRIVAADGRWEFYTGQDISPPDQYDAIIQAAHDADLQVAIDHRPLWSGQVGKRNHLLAMATGSDWVLPLDADWELKGNRTRIRTQLEKTEADAMLVLFHTPPNGNAPLQDVAATSWHESLSNQTILEPFVMRYLPEIRIDDYHWQHSGLDTNGNRVALWGTHHPESTRAHLSDMTITHWCLHRDQRTILANRAYCDQRDKYAAHHGREP